MPDLRPKTPALLATLKSQGREIARARTQAGIAQPHAAEVLEVSVSSLRNWEQGRNQAPAEIRRIAADQWGADPKLLGVDPATCPCCGQSLPWLQT